MTTYLEKLPACRATIRVELEPDLVRTERRKIVTKFAQKARIPGFRPGKIPGGVIEKRFRKEIEEELQDQLVRLGCREGVAKEKVELIQVLKLNDVELRDDDSFTFTAELQTAPEVELPEYRGISVTVQRLEVTDHDVEHDLEHIRFNLAKTVEVKDRPAQLNDFVLVDVKTEMDGVPVGDVVPEAAHLSSIQGAWMPLGENTVAPGFGGHVVGQGIGEVREFDLLVSADYPVKELAEKTVHFSVTLLGLMARELPEWSDELASSLVGGNGGMAELRELVRKRIELRQEEERRQEMTTQILEHLDSQTTFELPASILAEETQRQVNQIVRRGQMEGASNDELMGQKEDIIRYASTQAEVSVKTSYILQQVAEKEGIKAEEGEILEFCMNQAKQAGMPLKKYLNRVKKADMIGAIVDAIIRAKTLDLLRENASVTESDRAPHQCNLPEHQTA
jgi:trigger factor